jgi:1-deoxy-D-xylulose-5-phosphate synthase
MKEDEKIVVITPSTLYSTGLQDCFNKFPNRCFDPGMEEQHAMGLASGFALAHLKPIIFYQSTFLQRAFDQLFHDICFMNLPVMILSSRSGFAGFDSPTHHGIYDFAYLSGLPNLRMLYPKDHYELERMVKRELGKLKSPVWIGMPYGPADEIKDISSESEESFSKPEIVYKGKDMLLITVGHKYKAALKVTDQLRKNGIDCGLVNLRYLKPLPEQELLVLLSNVSRVVTIEEWVLHNSVSSSIANLILDNGLKCELLRIGIPDVFVEPGSNEELCNKYMLDNDGILVQIKQRWGELNVK